MSTIDNLHFVRASKPLGLDTPLPFRYEHHLFGLPLVIESNAERVIAWTRDLFETGHIQPDDAPASDAPLSLRVIIEPHRGAAWVASKAHWRLLDADHALVSGAGVDAVLDLAKGCGTLYVDECVLRERGAEYFTQAVLQGPLLTLPTRRDRHPVHAAAIRRGPAGLILCGPSGAGKSTLSYIASRAGIDVLCDDSIRVQRLPTLRVWAGAGGEALRHRRVHLREDMRDRFAELHAHDTVRLRNTGALKYVIPLPRTDGDALPFVERVRVCLLSTERGEPSLERVSAEEIVRAIVDAPEAVADMYELGRLPAAEAIAAGGGWRLRLSNDPEKALPLLLEMLDEV